ncbi:hypothetical protein HY502_01670 [Candidatus Woesebacteria bacterium]|nr:hypothetical protein [Candidatus Woesebacteria bacterium]
MERNDQIDPRWVGLEEDLAELSGGVTTDWYDRSVVRGGEVSFEGAAHLEIDLKQTLDQQVDDENTIGEGEVRNGLPPCKRVKKSF